MVIFITLYLKLQYMGSIYAFKVHNVRTEFQPYAQIIVDRCKVQG